MSDRIGVLENIEQQLNNLLRLQLAEIEAGAVDMSGLVLAGEPGIVRQSDGSFVVRLVEAVEVPKVSKKRQQFTTTSESIVSFDVVEGE